MSCDRCGKELPDGLGFCRECGNALAGEGQTPTSSKRRAVRTPFIVAALFAGAFLLLVVVLGFIRLHHQFREAEVAKAEADIRTQYESKGFTVEQVSMIKESDRRLSGYIRVRKSKGLVKLEFSQNCAATMDADSGRYIWECK